MSSSPTIATGNISLNGVVVSYQTVSGDNEWSLYITGAQLNASSTSWYNATTKRYGYHKFILKRDSEVLVSVKSSKIPTKTNYGKSLKKKAANRNKSSSEFKSYLNTKYTSLVNKTIHSAATTFVNKIESDSASYDPNAAIVNAELLYSVELKSTSQTTSLNLSVLGSTRNVPFSIPAKIDSGSGSGSESGEEQTTTTEELVDIDITSVNNGKNYVTNAQAYAKYGYVERVVDFSEVEDQNQLLKLAKIYAQNMQYDEMVLDISALDLHTLANNVNSLTLASNVRCISIPHGLDTYLPVTEIDIPLDDPAQVRYTLGSSGVGSMSSSTSSSAKLQGKRLSDKFTKISSNVLEVAIEHMSSVINQKTSGYVNIIQGENGSEAIVISSEPNWKTSHNLWKFDMNGLAYSEYPSNVVVSEESANNRTWKIGINMQGQIVANFINTGILSDGRDGQAARNYWNLDTGEFRLSSVDTLSNRVDILDTEPSGGENLLSDTDRPSLNKVAASDDRHIKFYDRSSDYTVTISELSPSDKPATSARYKIRFLTKVYSRAAEIQFYLRSLISLCENTVYTMSCWARCSNSNGHIQLRYGNSKLQTSIWSRLTTSWKLYSYTFTYNNSTVNTNNSIKGAKLYFVASMLNANSYIEMTSFKLEYGKRATSWSRSGDDLIYEAYDSAKNSKEFAAEAAKSLEGSLNTYKVWKALTNNGTEECIAYAAPEDDPDGPKHLYINATWINAGTLSGNLLKAGKIIGYGCGEWDLTNGKLITDSLDAYKTTIDFLLTRFTISGVNNGSDRNKHAYHWVIGQNYSPLIMRYTKDSYTNTSVTTNDVYPGNKKIFNELELIRGGFVTGTNIPKITVGNWNTQIRLDIPSRAYELYVYNPKSKNKAMPYYYRKIKTAPYSKKFVTKATLKKGKLKLKYGKIKVVGGLVET